MVLLEVGDQRVRQLDGRRDGRLAFSGDFAPCPKPRSGTNVGSRDGLPGQGDWVEILPRRGRVTSSVDNGQVVWQRTALKRTSDRRTLPTK